jgi:hypothetical protein
MVARTITDNSPPNDGKNPKGGAPRSLLAGNIHFPQIGPSLALSTASGKLMHTIMAGQPSSSASPRPGPGALDLSKVGQRSSDKAAKKVLALHREGLSYVDRTQRRGQQEYCYGSRQACGVQL